jgi:glycosyltransferase involved in cell wall biosynthesis
MKPGSDKNCPVISVVSPVYKAEKIVDELVLRLIASLEKITPNFEIILVEDGGIDNSWKKIVENCAKDHRVKGIKLSRNFGQHHAITAGLDNVRGEWTVVMDCDLQDRPEEIPNLYTKAQEGYDLIFARRARRQDNFNKKFYAFLFYKTYNFLSGVKHDSSISNFGIYSRKVVNALNQIREPMRAFSAMTSWVGFKSSVIDVYHDKRFEGKSAYTWFTLINLALNISIAYSDKPLKIVTNLGLVISASSVFYVAYILYQFFKGAEFYTGYTSLIISIWFLSGLIIFTLGVVGLYVGKTFDVVKNRPLYLIDEYRNNE